MKDFKVRCVDLNYCNSSCYDVNGVYEVKNGYLIDKTGDRLGPGNIKTIDDVNKFSGSKFELVTEPEQFTKDMLRTGMRVELRNGQIYAIIKDYDSAHYNHQNIFLARPRTFMLGSDYSNDLILKDINGSSYDIVNVFDSPCDNWLLDINKIGKLLWQRPEPKHYTLKEAEAKLSEIDGQPVKIGE